MSTTYNKAWLAGENVTPDKLNNFASGVLQRLYDKNLAIARTTTANRLYLNSAANAFVKYNRGMRVALTIQQGSAVMLGFSGSITQARQTGTTLFGYNKLDVLIDDSIYLSTLASVGATDGVFKGEKTILNHTIQGRFRFILTQLDEGTHTFELVGSVTPTGDATFTHELAPNCFFWVEEYGVNIGQLIGANNT